MGTKVHKTDAEWRRILTPDQYKVCRLKETEPPDSGTYAHCREAGVYRCVCCGQALFDAGRKFDSGTGWPSFTTPLTAEALDTSADRSHGMERTEVLCSRCDAHLGHVFTDGPAPEGLRYCINSVALKLRKAD